MASPDTVASFIARWSKAEAAERANYALFLTQLCGVLDVPPPDPAGPDSTQNSYVFERSVTFQHPGGKKSNGRIDLYKRDAFVCECKQYANQVVEPDQLALAIGDSAASKKGKISRGSDAWDRAMIEAHGQADRYARSLPNDEDPPPFLLVVDVGHIIELYADFSQKGKAYIPFPDPRTHRIRITELVREEVRTKLRSIWLDPLSLDPAKVSAAVTRKVAGHLAELAKSFEKKHNPSVVAAFLSRCIFCMFAEDIDLLPKDSFSQLLDSVKNDPGAAVPLLEQLFAEMNVGKFSIIFRKKILHFNGGLFADAKALPLNGTQLGLLRHTARLEWRHVEPAIFGTLLERALDPEERHKLGAHYTPRAYVERLVLPTVIEPLREEWTGVKTAAVTLASRGDLKGAIKETRAFHHRLCAVRILDPACGSGNFLYVTLEHIKRLEGEVLQLIEGFGENMKLDLGGEGVDPHQFLGIEINPRAATIAELVLWIGYLQWHHRNRGATEWPEPVLRAFKNVECRDAVLSYDARHEARDQNGKPLTIWDRVTMKTDAVTGRDVPDETAVVQVYAYINPNQALWPQADYIVGNPPFIGKGERMRAALGDEYVEALRQTYPAVPSSADYVMYWWYKAAAETKAGRTRQFGFITTNSIRQSLNRRVVQAALEDGIFLTFAIPDHPWIDSTDCAAVRIAMTVGALHPERVAHASEGNRRSNAVSHLQYVTNEIPNAETGENEVQLDLRSGPISADLTGGAEVSNTQTLKANSGLSFNGVMLASSGFILTEDEADLIPANEKRYLRHLVNGRDLLEPSGTRWVIDFTGLEMEAAREQAPKLFEIVISRVKPDREQSRDKQFRERWWLFGRSRPDMRRMNAELNRFIVTVETAKHRIFVFAHKSILPEHKLVVIGLADAYHLGVLSSRIHVVYALAAGSTLEDRPVYAASLCFQSFPFPDCNEKQKSAIRPIAEALDAHHKRAQLKSGFRLTEMYNVLEKVRARESLSVNDKVIHEAALLSTLKQLHDDLDKTVAEAYGWLWPMTDAEILEKIVSLNGDRASEEARGQIRWLRPEYQKPLFSSENQSTLILRDSKSPISISAEKRSGKMAKAKGTIWPQSMAHRAKAVEAALAAAENSITAQSLAKQFSRAKEKDVADILNTLVALGRAREGDIPGTYVY